MKAGIYRNPITSLLLYVAKDRSVRAVLNANGSGKETSEESRKEFRVRSRNNDAQIMLEDGTVCDRFSDVPNGCTDPLSALVNAADADATDAAPPKRTVIETPIGAGKSTMTAKMISDLVGHYTAQTGGKPKELLIGRGVELTESALRDAGLRVCHRQSARKHRRQGRIVFFVPSLKVFAWRHAS